ncbi:hypothetical protein [Massilia endophytica]|uniref:hypothetical protein n=1 Tax=Massilia endophytica TaxID=2899220 RepID=UPI001E4F092F|nr:hypothetical protein [Massilia endophytica]UGQ47856.1 hypothetical protein LSQ66_05140 [Massilia endophytica]
MMSISKKFLSFLSLLFRQSGSDSVFAFSSRTDFVSWKRRLVGDTGEWHRREMSNGLSTIRLQREDIRMLRPKTMLTLIAAIALALAAVVLLQQEADNDRAQSRKPYQLPARELARLSDKAPTDCAAALTMARHHLYASLELRQAEKFFRFANRCPSVGSMEGLLTVLRDPQDDTEVDGLVAALKKLDFARGQSAAQEIELRRSERAAR